MNGLTQLASQHPWALLTIFWIFANGVSTMPAPKSGGWTDGLGYAWLFNLLHAVSGTLGRIAAQYPGLQKLTGQVAPPAPPPAQP
jgi:hypothetical protein